MSHIVITGAGTGELKAAYKLHQKLGTMHSITLINTSKSCSYFSSYTKDDLGWRKINKTNLSLESYLFNHGINFITLAVKGIEPHKNRLTLEDSSVVEYDYLIINSGPQLAFDEVPGLGPNWGYTQSICTQEHSNLAHKKYQLYLNKPGPIVIGAAQGASCFGPAYEFAKTLDRDLRIRKLRDQVPITFITSEPYIGHLGLGGAGNAKNIMESIFRVRNIKWITNACVKRVTSKNIEIITQGHQGSGLKEESVPFKFAMILPAFKGMDAVAETHQLGDSRGFVFVNEYQCNPTYVNIYSAGVCIATTPINVTNIPSDILQAADMVENMMSAIIDNISASISGQSPTTVATWNTLCLDNLGDSSTGFLAHPQFPTHIPISSPKKNDWVHLDKNAIEKRFLRNLSAGI